MANENWVERRVTDGGGTYAYGCIRLDGKVFEPQTPLGFIRTGHTVQVWRLSEGNRISVRRVKDDGSLSGEETWECG